MGRGRTDVRVIRVSTEADTSDLRKIDRGLDDLASTFEDVQDEIKQTGRVSDETAGKLSSLVNGALMGVGLAIGNFVTGAVTDAITGFANDTLAWSDALNTLKATTDLTDTEFESLKNSAFDLFSNNFGESVDDITNKLGIAQRTTGLMGQELEQIVMQSERWGEFGADFEEGIRASNQLMQNFGITAEQAGDAITAVFVQAGDPQGELLDTFNEYSSTFAQMGFDADEFAQVLIDGAEAGIFSFDRLADAGREFGIRLREGVSNPAIEAAYDDLFQMTESVGFMMADGTKEAIDSYDELVRVMEEGGISQRAVIEQVSGALLEIEDPLERNRIAAELFGTQFEDLGEGVIEAFDGIDGAIGANEGAFDRLDSQLSGGLMETLKTIQRMISVGLFKAIEPFLNKLLKGLIPAIQDFGKLMKDDVIPAVNDVASEYLPKLTDAVDTVVDAIMPIVDAISDWIGKQSWITDLIQQFAPKIAIAAAAVAGIVVAFTAMSAIAAAVGAALALIVSPIGLIILGLAALMLAYETNFLGIADTIDAAVEDIGAAFDAVVEFVGGLVDAFKEGGLEGAGEFIKSQLIDPIIDAVKNIDINEIWESIKSFGSGILDAIKDGLSALGDGATWIYDNLISPLATAIAGYVASGALVDNLKSLGSAALDALKSAFSFITGAYVWFGLNVVLPLVSAVINYISSGSLLDNLKSLGTAALDALKSAFSFLSGAALWFFVNVVSPLLVSVGSYIGSGALWDKLKELGNSLLDGLKDALDVAKNAATLIYDNVIQPIIDEITGMDLTAIKDSFISIATDTVAALKTEFTTKIAELAGVIKSAINAIVPDSFGFSWSAVTVLGQTVVPGGSANVNLPQPFPGYQMGTPFTGFGGLGQIAGMVHHQEAVVPADGLRVYPDPNGLQLRGSMGGGGQAIEVTLELDGETLLTKLIDIQGQWAPA